MKINIISPAYFSPSGYGNHSKGIANVLGKIADVRLATQLFPNWELQCNDLELEMINKPDTLDRINIIIDLPFNWKQYTSKYTNLAYLVFEGDKIPLSWIDCISDEKITQVLVPSTHVYNAIKNSFKDGWDLYKHKIKIVPHGIDLNIFRPLENKVSTGSPFTFIMNKGFRGELDRGGVMHGLRAFIQEFNKGEARLIVKLNPAYTLQPDQLMQIVEKYRIEAGKSQDRMPDIFFNIANLPLTEIAKIYQEGDVFLNPTEGEAFSLPSAESLACSLVNIATNFGGQTDFIQDGVNGFLIDGKMHLVEHELIYEGISHMTIDLVELKKKMRWCYDNQDKVKEMKSKCIDSIKDWTWENSSKKVIESLKDIDR